MNPARDIAKLSLPARRVCELLSREPDLSRAAISAKLGMSYGGTKSLLNTLTLKGFIVASGLYSVTFSLTGKPFPSVADHAYHPKWLERRRHVERNVEPVRALERAVDAMVRTACA